MTKEKRAQKINRRINLLFKKSNLTVGQSSILSDASQRYTKNIIRSIKEDVNQYNQHYHIDKGKEKRDFSLETDHCILRRCCKRKLTSLTSSATSKYTTLTGINRIPVEKSEIPSSEISKSETFIKNNDKGSPIHIDATLLLLENLRNLLNICTKSHLVDGNKRFNKIIDSIQNKLYLDENKDSSCVSVSGKESRDLELKGDQTSTTCSGICPVCQKKRRYVSSTQFKRIHKRYSCHNPKKRRNPIKVISTLSVPRNLWKAGKTDVNDLTLRKLQMLNETSADSEDVTMKPNEILFDAKSNEPQCYDPSRNHSVTKNNVNMVTLFPKLFYKSSAHTREFDELPSLVRTMYIGNPENRANTEANFIIESKKEVFTLTDSTPFHKTRPVTILTTQSIRTTLEKKASSHAMVSKNDHTRIQKSIGKHSPNTLKNKVPVVATLLHSNDFVVSKNIITSSTSDKQNPRRVTIKLNSNRYRNKRKRRRKKYIYNMCKKQFSRWHSSDKKIKNSSHIDFVGCLENTIKNFFEHSRSKNIQFDVNVNLYPFTDDDNKKRLLSINKDNKISKDLFIENVKSNNEKIEQYANKIPSIDKVENKANCSPKCANSNKIHSDSNMKLGNNYITSRDILELKTMVKNISQITEKLYHQHLQSKVGSFKDSRSYTITKSKSLAIPKNISNNTNMLANPSYAIKDKLNTNFVQNNTVSDKILVPSSGEVVKQSLADESCTKVDETYKVRQTPSYTKTTIPITPPCKDISSKPKLIQTQSKGVQITTTALDKIGNISSLKHNKEPIKTDENQKISKSDSYVIIESESVLKVTDMTMAMSNAQKEVNSQMLKLISHLDLDTDTQNLKVIAICDNCSKEINNNIDTEKNKKPNDNLTKPEFRDTGFSADQIALYLEFGDDYVARGFHHIKGYDIEFSKPIGCKITCLPSCCKFFLYLFMFLIVVGGIGAVVWFVVLGN